MAEGTRPEDEMRPITALFADVVGSTGLGERLGPDEVKALVGECVTRMSRAVEEFGGSVLGKPIQVISADHQHKVEVGATTARRWFDTEAVDVIADIPNSAVALSVQGIAKDKKRCQS